MWRKFGPFLTFQPYHCHLHGGSLSRSRSPLQLDPSHSPCSRQWQGFGAHKIYTHSRLLLSIQAPRGLSAEEKRVKLVEILHETVSTPIRAQDRELIARARVYSMWCITERLFSGDGQPLMVANDRSHRFPFKLKELEKLGPKMKGIGAEDP